MDQRVAKRSGASFLTIEDWKRKIEEALAAPDTADPIRNINADDRRGIDAIFVGGGGPGPLWIGLSARYGRPPARRRALALPRRVLSTQRLRPPPSLFGLRSGIDA